MTSDEMNDIVMEKFKAIGSKRFINGIDLSPEPKEPCPLALALCQAYGIIAPTKREEPHMTLTDNVRQIQDLASHICELADLRDYEATHSKLDDISIKILKLHRHIDNLQRKAEPFPIPSEENVS